MSRTTTTAAYLSQRRAVSRDSVILLCKPHRFLRSHRFATRSPEELHRWLKERYKVHKQLGLKTYFPSINIAHSDIEEVVCHGDYCNSLETLGKRNQILSYENQKSNEELTVLREENRRLLGAVKRWHDKYQDILLRTQDEAPSYTETTPVKKFKTSCSTTDDLVLMRSG